MKENVFDESKSIEYMNQNFVYAEPNIYDDDIPAELRTKVTPLFYFIDGQKNHLIKKRIGGKTAPFFMNPLKQAAGAYKKSRLIYVRLVHFL